MESTVEKVEASEEVDQEKTSEQGGKKKSDKAEMLYLALKAMTAMKLTREDNQPAEIVERLFLGSIGAAFSKESLMRNGITHLLTCADKIQQRFPKVIKTDILNY